VLAKVFDAGADAVVLDLEDAVAPSAKDEARRLVASALAGRAGCARPRIAVRINGIDTPWWRDDLDAVVGPLVDVVRVPKAESAEQIGLVAAALQTLETRRNLALGSVGIVATLETAAGVYAAAEIARAPRVQAFTFGAADFVRDINADPAAGDHVTVYARQRLVLISRAMGIDPPVASVYTNVKDLDGLRRTTEEARAMGFVGRSCIHPSQVPIVQDVFTPTPEAVASARAIVAAWDEALGRRVAAFTLADGQFVDEAIARRARSVVARSAAIEEMSS
jgi:citrate lyase subunit beta/citryl-CoA lyase